MNDDFELSRRKALAALGTIGVASAGAGLGTSAYFSDQETFENNQLTAGELDMKVDWEEHYSDWSADEDDPADSADPELDIQMEEPDSPGDYTAFPPGVEAFGGVADDSFVNGDPLLYVNDDDVDQFMDNTSIEAFPDADDDGVQDEFDEANACTVLTDVGDGDPGLDSDERTKGSVGDPLINLQDVKPGDFGELTLSFHLCDNPGYVWLNGEFVEARENGHTEPEADDPDEEGEADEVATEIDNQVELLDEIQTALWYDDDCNNLTDAGSDGGEADVVIVLDTSGSMNDDTNNDSTSDKFNNMKSGAQTLVDALGDNTQVGLVTFDNGATPEEPLGTAKSTVKSTIGGLSSGGGTNVGAGITEGQNELTGSNARSTADKFLVVLTNGNSSSGRSEATTAKDAGTTIYGIAYGNDANENLIEDISSPPKVDDGTIDVNDEFAFDGDVDDIGGVFDDIGQSISGEEIFFQGSLRTALEALTDGNGIPLDGIPGDFNEIDGDDNADDRDCFAGAGTTHCIGFSWWLPTDHANEIQGDSVSFDLGFYTEQCRHNDGSGMNNAAVSNEDEIDA